MRDAWDETLRPFAPPGEAAAEVFRDLAARYAEPARHYHTLTHLAAMWESLEWLNWQGAVRDVTALRLALWFHDAVYDPRAADNEARSAGLARAVLPRLHVTPATLAAVEALILATRAHEAAPGDTDGGALLDCDLVVLGGPDDAYDAYAQAIRREYAWVPAADYRAGRGKVLGSFLDRESIYLTPPMCARYEAAARRNLQRERDALG